MTIWYVTATYEDDDLTVEAIWVSQKMRLPMGPKFSVDEFSSEEEAKQAADLLWETRKESEDHND